MVWCDGSHGMGWYDSLGMVWCGENLSMVWYVGAPGMLWCGGSHGMGWYGRALGRGPEK